MNINVTYADVTTRQAVERWAEDKGFDAENQLCLHFEERFERFETHSIHVDAVDDQGDFLILRLKTDCWESPREFALMNDGVLCW